LQEYRGCADRLIRPHLGGLAVAKLRPARIAEWVAILLKRGGKPTKDADGALHERPLSPKSVYHAFTLVNGAMRFAVRMDLAGRNPCEAATRPSIKRSAAKAIPADELKLLLAAGHSTRWEWFVNLGLCTGARRGELCGLSWDDFDSDNGTLAIRHSLSQTRRGIRLKATKTGHTRTLSISPAANAALRSQRALQARERLSRGPLYANPDNAIFADESGRRITPMAATCAFERIARKAGISTTRLHDLRHTAATMLILAGIDIVTIAGILGHESPVTTLRIYAHLMPERQGDALDRLGKQFELLTGNAV
jgi:integrase